MLDQSSKVDRLHRSYGELKAEREERRKRRELKRLEKEKKGKENEKRREILERFDRKLDELKRNNVQAEVSLNHDDGLPKCWKCPECGKLNMPADKACFYCGLILPCFDSHS
jgi:rubrerythrin